MILVNGKPEKTLSIFDRGLQYGDGLFETMAFRNDQLEFRLDHIERLKQGCERLKIEYRCIEDLLSNEIDAICNELEEDSVIKIIVTRGQGARGYRVDKKLSPTRIVSSQPLLSYPALNTQGITVRLCQHTLPENKYMAGIKHLNRLDQVIARSEWDNDDIAEGLMLNQQQQIIEGTMSNLFIVKDEMLFTPELSLAGVSGVMRQQVMKLAKNIGFAVNEANLTLQDLKAADEVFICNSLINIWPVIEIVNLASFRYGNISQNLQRELANCNKE
jgi:4-amino-4-deoxychorismate lyase